MGRRSYSNRLTTRECESVSVYVLREHNCFASNIRSGQLSWSWNGHKTGTVGFVVSTAQGAEYIGFQYTQTEGITGEKTNLDYKVHLTSTACNFGGRRWWFICPLTVNGRHCGRRVGVLYLAGKFFGCRHCNNLVYESSRNHRSFYEAFAKRLMISNKYEKICQGEGRKGFSKRELSQLGKLLNKNHKAS